MSRRILVADDSSTIQKVIKIAFARYDVEMLEASSFVEALVQAGKSSPSALIIDASLPGARGPADFAKLQSAAGGAEVLLLVGTYESVDEGAFRQAGFQHFLKKPFESNDIVTLLDRLLGGDLTKPRSSAAGTAGPMVPPLPGSQNRSRHATVIHAGGLESLDAKDQTDVPEPLRQVSGHDLQDLHDVAAEPPALDFGDDFLAGPAPPPPEIDQARRGRRAFSQDALSGDKSGRLQAAPPPPPFKPLGVASEEGELRRASGSQKTNTHNKIPAWDAGLGPSEEDLSLALSAPHEPKGPSPTRQGSSPAWSNPGLSELPALVKKAVEDYCERHFKSLAKEVIAAELRRLADEKARHLVDN